MSNQEIKKLDGLTLSELRASSSDVKQSVVALLMNVQEPAISKMEKKAITSVPVDKLRRYLSAIGVSLEVTLILKDGEKIHMQAD